ncbi:MAG: endolytic transglycosylase MltG [Minwuia sp.]|nr:endolytic transglycosylase MltG [Minwuia sp.]
MRAALRLLLLVVVVGIALGGVVAWNWWQGADAPGPLPAAETVVIDRGTGPRAIADKLVLNGVIDDRMLFLAVLKVRDLGTRLKAGEYAFTARQSLNDVIAQVVAGNTVVRRVTLAEGLTAVEVADVLNATVGMEGKAHVPPEGAVLPETYHYKLGDDRQEIIRRARIAMRDTLRELWPQRQKDLPLEKPADAVILASIVEKETGVAGERARVAAVFINRLRQGMRLQSDPTVIYAVTEGKVPFDRALTRKDLNNDSRYNTYRHGGLPPGPIASPGRAAIAAVLNPADTNELYFVADGSGGHAFARTLKEHNSNVRRWRQLIRKQGE